MKVLIIEDEPHAAARLKRFVEKVSDEEVVVVGICPSVVKSVEWLDENQQPDLIFMDIRLEDGECFEIFDVVDVTAPIIFCTAYAEYAVEAFRVKGVDYILKPIVEADLRSSIEKYKKLRGLEHAASNWHNLKPDLKPGSETLPAYTQRLMVIAGKRFLPISVKDVCVFQAHEKGVLVKRADGSSWHMEDSLSAMEAGLNPADFVRISRQAIVNLNHVFEMSRSDGGYTVSLCAQPQFKYKVSRAKVSMLKQALNR